MLLVIGCGCRCRCCCRSLGVSIFVHCFLHKTSKLYQTTLLSFVCVCFQQFEHLRKLSRCEPMCNSCACECPMSSLQSQLSYSSLCMLVLEHTMYPVFSICLSRALIRTYSHIFAQKHCFVHIHLNLHANVYSIHTQLQIITA